MPRGAPVSAVLLFATAAYAANQPSTRPMLLSRGLREVMLRQVDQSSDSSDRAHAEWYTPDAEALLQRLLSGLPEAPASQRKSKGNPVEGWDGFDTEALFLLCRAQMGCLEAALKELDQASRMVGHVREKWQLISGGTASQIFNENVMRAARATRRLALLTARGLSMRKTTTASTNHSLDGVSGDGVSGEITAASDAADLEAGGAPDPQPSDESSPPAERESPLGSPHSRLGMGARRRALLRSERAMSAHAGALHDLRVALSAAGGEWLELGRWLGGPPLPEMEWEVGLDANRRRLLLRLCLRTTEALAASANALRDHGPFQLYRAPPVAPSPPLSALTDEAALAQFAPPSTALALIAQTRLSLAALQKLRRGVRRYTPPDEVRPPGVLQRHSLAWLLWLAFAVFAYIKVMVHGWLPPFLASREEIRHASAEIAATTVRFWRTHVTEPVTGIWHELNHGVEKTIDPSTVRETEKSLSKMVGEFIRDVHGENAPSSTRMAAAEFEAAMARAAAGSLEDVMNVYENQIRKPIGGLLGGELLRALLLQVVQLKLLMEQEVEAVDRLLIRNDFNLQLMATVPAFLIVSTLFWAIRHLWRRARVAKGRDPIEQLRAEMVEITLLLARAERPPGEARIRSTDFGEALTQFEASPMQLQEVGELVFRVQRFRESASRWLRGYLRTECMHDAQLLLDSGRSGTSQRGQVANSLLRRLDNLNALVDHW